MVFNVPYPENKYSDPQQFLFLWTVGLIVEIKLRFQISPA